MLSGETANGKYPIKAVQEMTNVITATQDYIDITIPVRKDKLSDVITSSLNTLLETMDFDAVITVTRSGYTTRMISRFRNNEPLLCVTREAKVARQLHLVYGAIPIHYPKLSAREQMSDVLKFLVREKHLRKDSLVAITAGVLSKKQGTNSVTVIRVKDAMP